MAGKNQHYLPQFAQRPFKTNELGNRPKTYMYEKSAPPNQSRRIEKVGAESFFYSDDGPTEGPNLDMRITDLENELALTHQELLSQKIGPVRDENATIRLVQHLGMRTRAVRTTVMDGLSEALDSAMDVLARPGFFQDLLSVQRGYLEGEVEQHLNDPSVKAAGLDVAAPQAVSPILSYAVREAFAPRLEEIGQALTRQFKPMLDLSDNKAAFHHQDVMSSSLEYPNLPESLLAMIWSVVEWNFETPLILPDCATITFNTDGEFSPGVFVMDGDHACTLLPLSPNRLLIGLAHGNERPDDAAILNALGACSQEFFIAGICTTAYEQNCQSIGQAGDMIRGLLDKMAHDAVDPLRDVISSEGLIGSPRGEKTLAVQNFSTLAKDQVQVFANAMGRLLGRLAPYFDISVVKELVIAEDFSVAMEMYDIGNDALRSHIEDGLIQGKAVSRVWIERDEAWGAALLVNPNLFEALAAEDADMVDWAFENLLDALISVDVNTVLNRDARAYLNGQNDGSLANGIPEELHLGLLDYLIARRSRQNGRTMEPFEKGHSADLDSSVTAYEAVLAAYAPQPTQTSEEIMVGVYGATEASMSVLVAACRFLGTHSADARSTLTWLPLLAADLDALWRTYGFWEGSELLVNLERHFERLVWGFGIVMQRQGDQLRFDHMDNDGRYAGVLKHIEQFLSDDVLDSFGISVEALEIDH